MDQLIETALDAGAFGAKLTGGGPGGCVLALAAGPAEAAAGGAAAAGRRCPDLDRAARQRG
ncbi:hypothetical protein [Nonomuraea sp. JJY05]|uniref:hypothetical protein n=1 Tax=Nonomuraea sp. JJY05 TaxID=3350255 RepID=UPI00373F6623